MSLRPSAADALAAAFAPRSIALVGVSRDPRKLGSACLRLLLANGYAGRIHPVHPEADTIQSLPTVRSLRELPQPVDLVLVCTPSDQALANFRECAAVGAKVVVGVTSGFAEAGAAGATAERDLRGILRDAPFRLIGPNCEGIVAPGAKLQLTFSPNFDNMHPGVVSIVSQSGALSGYVASRLTRKGVGINMLASSGNETDLTAIDYIETFIADPATQVVFAYLEEIRDAARFVKLARSVRGRKTLVVQKGGRSTAGTRAAASHTGALTGSQRVTAGVFDELGIVAVRDSTAAVDALAALSIGKRLRGSRIGIVSIVGGLAVEMTDLAEGAGFTVPEISRAGQRRLRAVLPAYGAVRNPVDVTGTVVARPELLRAALEVVAEEKGLDAIVVVLTFVRDPQLAQAIIDTHRATAKPVLVVWTASRDEAPEAQDHLTRQGVPVFDAPPRVLSALCALRGDPEVA